MKLPHLSIITVNLNNSAGLEKTISSVLTQTFMDYEFIIIDGGSTDSSRDIIRSSQEKITSWISEKDNGIYHAMNKGIQLARGIYCLFLNSGDYLLTSTSLEEAFSFSPTEDLVYCDTVSIVDGKKEEYSKYPDKLTFYNFYIHTPICHQATFIKKDLLNSAGMFDESYKYASDWFFFMKALLCFNASYRHLPIPLIDYDIGGISANPENKVAMLAERQQIVERNFSFIAEDYEKLQYEIQYHKNISGRKLIRRLKDIFLYITRSKGFDR